MKHSSVVSSPLHADLTACSGTHTEVLLVQVCGPVESMQYIFPINNRSTFFSNLQLSLQTASLRRSSCVRSDWPLSQYSRLHPHVQTSNNHKIFFVCLFLTMKDTIFLKNSQVSFIIFTKRSFFCALMHDGLCLIHSLAAYKRCCCF